jgi:hypothetical protein
MSADAFSGDEWRKPLDMSARGFRKGVKAPPDGERLVRGQPTPLYRFESLPPRWQAVIEECRARSGLATVAEYMQGLREVPAAEKPWEEFDPVHRELATKLCEALAPVLETQHTQPEGVIDRAAVAYRQHFGHNLLPDRLRYILDRATRDDKNQMQFRRPRLYLDASAYRTPEQAPLPLSSMLAPLSEILRQMSNLSAPTAEDRAHLFHFTFKHFEEQAALHPEKGRTNAIKSAVVRWLQEHFPALFQARAGVVASAADRALAARRLFNLKLAAWTAGGRTLEAVRDRRAFASGRKAHQCTAGCYQKARELAKQFRGRRGNLGAPARAWRTLQQQGELCAECRERDLIDLRTNKSRLRPALRRAITPNKLEIAKQLGPRAVRAVSPRISRDWSDVLPGDWFCADDETSNHRVWHEVDIDGERRIFCGRVQTLLIADFASFYPIAAIHYFGAPTGRQIRQLCQRAFIVERGGVGLPRHGCVFERGVFESRLVVGDKSPQALEFRETEAAFDQPDAKMYFGPVREMGIRDHTGLHIHHATTPSAKTIERTFLELQERMSCIKEGFCGFDERREASEAMKDFTVRVSNGREDCRKEWMSLDTYAEKYRATLEEFRREQQNGALLRGYTPLDVWSKALAAKPLRALPRSMEYALSTHKKLIPKVGTEISFAVDRYTRWSYWSEELSRQFGGQKAIAYQNLDFPEVIHVTDLARTKLVTVEGRVLKAMTATPAQLKKTSAERSAVIAHATTVHKPLARPVNATIARDADHAPQDRKLGLQIETAENRVKAEIKEARAVSTVRAREASQSRREAEERLRLKSQNLILP